MTKSAFLGFGWLRPGFAAWSLAALVLVALGLWAVHRRAALIDSLVAPRQRPRFVPRLSLNRARARFVLAALALGFLALALAGPVRGFTLREIRRRGLDLVVCVDTSRSMLVRDLRPDRITRARREVKGLIERLRGDRMALIAFAGDPREVAPLTHDRNALESLLDGVTPAENEKGGTDLGAALERALAMFDGRTGAHEGIVMLTDGEDLEGHGLEIARKAAERGVKVFIVGMGTEAGGKIPVDRPGGTGEMFLRDAKNQEVVSAMSGKTLEEIAKTTGGAYLSADSSAAPLEELYDKRISRLEAREVQGGQEFVPHDRFQWFVGVAAFCMLGAAGLRERRGRAPKRRRAKQPAARGTSARERAKPAWAHGVALVCFAQLAAQAPAPQSGPLQGAPPAAQTAPPQRPAPLTGLPQSAQPATQPVAPAQGTAPQGSLAPPAGAATDAAKTAPAIPAYPGPVRSGLEELRRALEAKELDRARTLGEALIVKPALADDVRAEIEYHRGIVAEARDELADASAAFARAGGLASPGELRLDAWYDAGTVDLAAAEQLYLQIPEVREARKLPPLAAPQPGPGAPAAAPATPADKNKDLDQAAAAYNVAKQGLVLRLRADARDPDTRANLELIQRRLHALDKLRHEREEKEKQEQQKQKQDDKQKQDQKPQDDKDKDKDKQDQDKQDPSKQDDKGKQDKPSKDPQEKPQQNPEEQQKPEDGDKKSEPPKPKDAKPADERQLSKEQVSRLLDQLQAIDQEARELQARIRAHRRPPVSKDW